MRKKVALAKLLDARGELNHAFNCADCERGKPGAKRKRALGCGVPPERRGQEGEAVPFDVRKVLAALEKKGVRREFWGRDASRWWRFANIGNPWSSIGSLWECCPAWYARYAGGEEALIANHAVELTLWADRNSLDLIHDGGPLTPRVASLVNMLNNANIRLSNEAQARALKKKG